MKKEKKDLTQANTAVKSRDKKKIFMTIGIVVACLAVCLHFSVCISFDMPRMSCILNIYLRSFIQYAVFKVQSVCSLS